jgi:hypothetical protein
MFRNTVFDTVPAVIHGHGRHQFKPHWEEVLAEYHRTEVQPLVQPSDLTILTCNSGHEAMGLLEDSCKRSGLDYQVCGQGRDPWVNSRDKPESILEGLSKVETPYVLYADSRDAIVVGCLREALQRFLGEFSECRLLFGADRINWPHLREFKKFEESVAPENAAEGFLYLNGGVWIGQRGFCLEFFEKALETEPVPQAADSEQGVLKKLYREYYPRVQLDYRCSVFQNLGFVLKPIMERSACESSSIVNSDTALATSPERD